MFCRDSFSSFVKSSVRRTVIAVRENLSSAGEERISEPNQFSLDIDTLKKIVSKSNNVCVSYVINFITFNKLSFYDFCFFLTLHAV